MRRVLQPFRFFAVIFSILVYLVHMGVVWLLVRRRWSRVAWANRILMHYTRWGLWVLRVRARVIGVENLGGAGVGVAGSVGGAAVGGSAGGAGLGSVGVAGSGSGSGGSVGGADSMSAGVAGSAGGSVDAAGRGEGSSSGSALYVGNHLSYMDVLVISSRLSASFVTSMEIKEAPGLGLICQMAGCLFVERRNKTNIHNEVLEISQALKNGINVAIFPEATSTNGEQVLRFRKPLYVAAMDAERPVVPFCLNYREVGGRPIDVRSRDSIFWYGDMDFVPHLWALAGSGGVNVDLHFMPPLMASPASDALVLAETSQRAVESVFRPVR